MPLQNDFYPLYRRTEMTIEEPNFGVNAYKKGVPRKPNQISQNRNPLTVAISVRQTGHKKRL